MKKGSRKTAILCGAFGLCFLLLIILNCSGLLFPLPSAQGNLKRGVKDSFGVTLPASAKVLKGVYVAEMDKSEFFMVQMDPADVLPFSAALEAASVPRGYIINNRDPRFEIGVGGPSWYTPGLIPDLVAQRISIPRTSSGRSSTGYWFFFSPSTGRAFVYWYMT